MLGIDDRLLVIVVALVLDALIREPPGLWERIPHPVALIGRAVDWIDREFNRESAPPDTRRAHGVVAIFCLLAAAVAVGWLGAVIVDFLPLSVILEALIVAVLVAGRSLHDHVAAVADGLVAGGLEGGRAAVRHIVGRDPDSLDEAGVARAAIESAAENFSDGIAAPVFWYALLGLPGILAYKAVNTADSMIGHRSERHEAFGAAAARLDDALNWVPARLSGGLIAAAAWMLGEDGEGAAHAMLEDAAAHRSVNAGWPEAAMAGALGLALGGPRRYGGLVVEDAWMNHNGREDAGITDIHRALRLFVMAGFVHGALYGVLAILF